ncbi:MAG: hypothetical protein H0U53_00170 [Actinobacteria bacterium]|nr:hypothetical protein [Actinomycetota bacterium]
MARDLLQIVDKDLTFVKALNDAVSAFLVKDSLQHTPSAPGGGIRRGGRGRWEGYQQLTDVRDNGELSFSLIITWLTIPSNASTLEFANEISGELSSAMLGRLIEFRHRESNVSSFFEVRGPAQYKMNFRLGLLGSKKAIECEFRVPVGPLIRGNPVLMGASATVAFPAKVALPLAVTGKAPALCDMEIDVPTNNVAPPIFAAVGWSKRMAGSPPFGIIEGESINGSNFDGLVASGDATMRGGGYAYKDLAIGTYGQAYFLIQPWLMTPDDFSDDIDVEVYAVLKIPSTAYGLRCAVSTTPTEGAAFGQRYGDLGTRGRPIVAPSSTAQKRITNLGVVKIPCVPVHSRWLMLEFFWNAGSSGLLSVDYLVLLPARRSVSGPTGKVSDATYPRFMPALVGTTKRVLKHDGTGLISIDNGSEMPYPGMGARIELPPGDVDVTVLLASMVPDDPSINDSGLILSHNGTLRARTYPRNYSVRGV